MLGQWFGSSEGGDDPVLKSLPLPAFVDIDFVGEDRAAPMEALRALVAREAPGARIIPHAEWLGPVARLIRRSEEHTSELQSLMRISYAVFCLKKKTIATCNST